MPEGMHSLGSVFFKSKDKKSLRAFYKEKTASISLKQKKEQQIVHLLNKLSLWESPGCIAVYRAMKDEPCLSSFYKSLKNKVCFPVIQNEELAFYSNKEGRWQSNRFQISEPLVHPKNHVPLKSISIFLVPGQVFDRRGGRLGRGHAYYDKTLAVLNKNKTGQTVKDITKKRPLLIGVSFAERIHNEALPLDSHDVLMDVVVTDRFVLMPLDQRG